MLCGNHGCIQIHSGPVRNIKPWARGSTSWTRPSICNLARTHHRLWAVRKPNKDGHVTSIEAYDSEQRMIIQFFGKRRRQGERDDWRLIADNLPVAPLQRGVKRNCMTRNRASLGYLTRRLSGCGLAIAMALSPALAPTNRQKQPAACRDRSSVTMIIHELGQQHRLVARDTTSQFPDASPPSRCRLHAACRGRRPVVDPDLIIALEGSGPPETIEVLERASCRSSSCRKLHAKRRLRSRPWRPSGVTCPRPQWPNVSRLTCVRTSAVPAASPGHVQPEPARRPPWHPPTGTRDGTQPAAGDTSSMPYEATAILPTRPTSRLRRWSSMRTGGGAQGTAPPT